MENVPAVHFVVEAEDPSTGVRIGRSYFLGTGKCADRVVDKNALVTHKHPELDKYIDQVDTATEVNMLRDVYLLLLKSLHGAVLAFHDGCQTFQDGTSKQLFFKLYDTCL